MGNRIKLKSKWRIDKVIRFREEMVKDEDKCYIKKNYDGVG
jgi:hypothetical protein